MSDRTTIGGVGAESVQPPTRTAEPRNVAGGPLLEPHDAGCRCWPHVGQDDAIRAVEHAALMEYRSKVAAAPAGLPTDEQVEAWLKANDLIAVIDKRDAAPAGLDVERELAAFREFTEQDRTEQGRYYVQGWNAAVRAARLLQGKRDDA